MVDNGNVGFQIGFHLEHNRNHHGCTDDSRRHHASNSYHPLYSFSYLDFPATAMTCCARLQRKKQPQPPWCWNVLHMCETHCCFLFIDICCASVSRFGGKTTIHQRQCSICQLHHFEMHGEICNFLSFKHCTWFLSKPSLDSVQVMERAIVHSRWFCFRSTKLE